MSTLARPAIAGDVSLWSVVAGNALTMGLALTQKWPLTEIMWVYWWQSVIIGATNFVRMWNLKEFSTQGFSSNGKRVPETPAGARSTALFFAAHYGLFHFVYMVFLFVMPSVLDEGARQSTPLDAALVAMAALGFAASHVFSLRYNASRDFRQKRPNLGALMLYPYLRIIPMHMTIIIGGVVGGVAIWLFMMLKTAADAGMHIVEHRIFQAES